MKVLSKNNSNDLIILAMKTDVACKGDYLLIEEDKSPKRMIVQIYEEEYLSSQSLVEEIIKDEVIVESSTESLHDPLNIGCISRIIRDARLFRAKIRATIDPESRLTNEVTWLPSRVSSRLSTLPISELNSYLKKKGAYSIELGTAGRDNEQYEIYAEDLDGKLNIITGKKESGKSH